MEQNTIDSYIKSYERTNEYILNQNMGNYYWYKNGLMATKILPENVMISFIM